MPQGHAEFIDALGGRPEICGQILRKTGKRIRPEAVSNWKMRGVPWRWRNLLKDMAEERGVDVPPDFLEVR